MLLPATMQRHPFNQWSLGLCLVLAEFLLVCYRMCSLRLRLNFDISWPAFLRQPGVGALTPVIALKQYARTVSVVCTPTPANAFDVIAFV